MKPKDKILTYAQANELKWFCGNVTGVRTDFNSFLDEQEKFKRRIERLEKTCELIERYFGELLTNPRPPGGE